MSSNGTRHNSGILHQFTHIKHPDEVIIGLACLQKKGQGFNKDFIVGELIKSAAIAAGLSGVAIDEGKEPPNVIVSILFDPDVGDPKFTPSEFNAAKTEILELAKNNGLVPPLIIEDFCARDDVTPDERAFLKEQQSIVHRIDIVKTHASANSKGNCLVIDSNTICSDFKALYADTFGSKNEHQINACWYDTAHVTCHNKVWYTAAASEFKNTLKATLDNFMKQAANDPSQKERTKNSIFNFVFCPAASSIGAVEKNTDLSDGWNWYVANLKNLCFSISRSIMVSNKMSWAASDRADAQALPTELANKEPLIFKDAAVDFPAIYYIVKKYTSNFERHQHGENGFNHEEYGSFLKFFNNDQDFEILARFFNMIKDKTMKSTLPNDLNNVINLVPKTPRGDLLIKLLFGVKDDAGVRAIRESPQLYAANESLYPSAVEEFKMETIRIHSDNMIKLGKVSSNSVHLG